jgi:hypothetical protein
VGARETVGASVYIVGAFDSTEGALEVGAFDSTEGALEEGASE